MKIKWSAILMALCLVLPLTQATALAADETADIAFIISETATVDSFTLPEGTTIQAPSGKLLSVTVNGVEMDLVPGETYTGEITFTVTDKLDVTGHEGSAADWAGSDYRTAIYLDENGLQESGSVLAAAPDYHYDNGELTVGKIVSQGTTFNGVIVTGGDYIIRDAEITLNGDGGNDFNGYGAAVLVTGDDTQVVLDNASIDATGLTRGALATAGSAKVLVMNSTLASHEGVLPEDYVQNVENSTGLMKAAPWTLGISGTNRATNLLGSATTTYFNSAVSADGWGVLSADDATAPVMNIVNSTVSSQGQSVYGAFGIGDGSAIKILGSTFDVTGILVNLTAGTLLIGPASQENMEGVYGADEIIATGLLDETAPSVLRCQREGLRVGGGSVAEIQPGTVIETGGASILSKGGNAQLFFDGAQISSEAGIILQLMDSDDAGANFLETGAPLNTSYTDGDVTPVYIEGRDLTKVNHDYEGQALDFLATMAGEYLTVNGSSGLALEASFANMDLTGDFYNSSESFTTADRVGVDSSASNMFLTFDNTTVKGVISSAMAEHVDPVTGEIIQTIDTWEEVGNITNTVRPVINNGVNVTLTGGSVWTVTGTSYLSCLVVESGSQVIGSMTVDGVETPIQPGTYTGSITLVPLASASGEASVG